jgi:hypothetical protein
MAVFADWINNLLTYNENPSKTLFRGQVMAVFADWINNLLSYNENLSNTLFMGRDIFFKYKLNRNFAENKAPESVRNKITGTLRYFPTWVEYQGRGRRLSGTWLTETQAPGMWKNDYYAR